MKACLLVICVIVASFEARGLADTPAPPPRAPRAVPAACDMATKEGRQACIASRLEDRFTSGTSVVDDALQAVAQVVLKRATRAAWGELKDRLVDLADCAHTHSLTQTCTALEAARIEDILVSPKFLLDAFVSDLFADVLQEPASGGLIPLTADSPTARVLASWKTGRLTGVLSEVRASIMSELRERADTACPAAPATAAFWLVGVCLLDLDAAADPGLQYGACDFDKHLNTCALSDADKQAVRRVAQLAGDTFGGDAKVTGPASIQLFFEWAKLADPSRVALLDGLESVCLGLVSRDWLRVIAGVGAVSTAVPPCDASKPCPKPAKALLALLGAVGQFAETYQDPNNKTDPTVAAAARQKVIEDLVTSMVDRSDRKSGAVISLGGALGLLGGARYNDKGSEWAFPVRLTLGIGLQTYWWQSWGFHVSVDAFDLGQYVTYSSGQLDVAPPEAKSVIVAGATAGFWLLNRETPLFIAGHASVSPFVRTTDGKLTYEAGLMVGMYVPLLDFN